VHRYFVTGTDTDVGKTRVAAALARALQLAGERPTVVKLVQTGLAAGAEGDAQLAGRLAGAPHLELARFAKAADPWTASLSEGRSALTAEQLAAELDAIPGAVVAEGAGGVMVPLNRTEHLGNVAVRAKLQAVIAVGLRLGCLNHTLLTLALCRELGLPVAGAVLVERWGTTEPHYRTDVERVLQGKLPILGILPFAPDEAECVEAGAKLFQPLVNQNR
jgi:dethiobiotin synthetase